MSNVSSSTNQATTNPIPALGPDDIVNPLRGVAFISAKGRVYRLFSDEEETSLGTHLDLEPFECESARPNEEPFWNPSKKENPPLEKTIPFEKATIPFSNRKKANEPEQRPGTNESICADWEPTILSISEAIRRTRGVEGIFSYSAGSNTLKTAEAIVRRIAHETRAVPPKPLVPIDLLVSVGNAGERDSSTVSPPTKEKESLQRKKPNPKLPRTPERKPSRVGNRTINTEVPEIVSKKWEEGIGIRGQSSFKEKNVRKITIARSDKNPGGSEFVRETLLESLAHQPKTKISAADPSKSVDPARRMPQNPTLRTTGAAESSERPGLPDSNFQPDLKNDLTVVPKAPVAHDRALKTFGAKIFRELPVTRPTTAEHFTEHENEVSASKDAISETDIPSIAGTVPVMLPVSLIRYQIRFVGRRRRPFQPRRPRQPRKPTVIEPQNRQPKVVEIVERKQAISKTSGERSKSIEITGRKPILLAEEKPALVEIILEKPNIEKTVEQKQILVEVIKEEPEPIAVAKEKPTLVEITLMKPKAGELIEQKQFVVETVKEGPGSIAVAEKPALVEIIPGEPNVVEMIEQNNPVTPAEKELPEIQGAETAKQLVVIVTGATDEATVSPPVGESVSSNVLSPNDLTMFQDHDEPEDEMGSISASFMHRYIFSDLRETTCDTAPDTAEEQERTDPVSAAWQPIWPPQCHALKYRAEEQIQSLADHLETQRRQGRKVVSFNGFHSGDGCTTLLLCAVRELAERGLHVLLVDSQCRNPELPHLLGIDQETPDDSRRMAQHCEILTLIPRRLELLPWFDTTIETPCPGKPEILTFFEIVGRIKDEFDLVLVDNGFLSDGPLAERARSWREMHSDGVILVINKKNPLPVGIDLVEYRLRQHHTELLGVTENHVVETFDNRAA